VLKKKSLLKKQVRKFGNSNQVRSKLRSLLFASLITLYVPVRSNPTDLPSPVMFWELSPVVAPILYITDNYFLCDCLFIACPLGTTLQEVPDDMGSKGLSK